MMNLQHLTRDFHYDRSCNGIFRLEIRDYHEDYRVFELSLMGLSETISLDYMLAEDHPELLDLYDFENKRWVESELACFWEGLQVCLA